MQDDKRPLDIDLSFLDGKPRQEAPPPIDTGYKFNWKNIALFAVIALGIGVVVIANESSTPNSTSWSSPVVAPSSPSPPLSYSDVPVTVGQYRCSQYDANQADELKPGSSAALDAEQEALEGRSSTLSALHQRIEASNIGSYSSESEIEQYNEMVDRYNALLGSYRGDAASLQARVRQFNTQIEAYNSYLTAHCTSR
jgi:hypothetical protein